MSKCWCDDVSFVFPFLCDVVTLLFEAKYGMIFSAILERHAGMADSEGCERYAFSRDIFLTKGSLPAIFERIRKIIVWTCRLSPLRHALLKSLKIADELNTVSQSGLVKSWQLCMLSQSTTEVLATLASHRHTQFIISQYCTLVPVAVSVYSILAHHVKRITFL